MPLAMLAPGNTRRIADLKGQDDTKRRLQELGFIRGEPVRVIGESSSGMILLVKGVKVALNRALANKIMVADAVN